MLLEILIPVVAFLLGLGTGTFVARKARAQQLRTQLNMLAIQMPEGFNIQDIAAVLNLNLKQAQRLIDAGIKDQTLVRLSEGRYAHQSRTTN
jgi:predicted transcriptional regulator